MGGAVSSGRDNDELIDNLMSGNYIRSKEVERVFRALDRAEYMTPEAREQAYKDLAWRNGPLHLSSPCIYSEVMEGLELKPGLSFLNVGSGTGYLSTLAGLILGTAGISHGVEVHPAVVEYASKKIRLFFENSAILDDFDFCEPKFYNGNGLCLSQLLCGYDRVYCGAGCPAEYEDYFKRLIKVGGILVMPLNDTLLQVRRVGVDEWKSRNLLNVSFATLRVPTAEEADDKVTLDKQTPVRLMYLARASIRESMRGGLTRRHPVLREKPRPPPPAACPRRICIPLEPEGELEGLNILHDLDSENGANEMNALLSLVISMGQNRGAGALRFDRLSRSDSEDEDDGTPDRPDPDNDPQDNPNEDNDNQDNRNQHNDSQVENRNQGNDNQVNHNHSNDNQVNHNQNNDHPVNQNRVNDNPDRLPAAERFPDFPNEDPGSRRIDSDNVNDDLPRIRGSVLSNGLLGGGCIDSDEEEYIRQTFDKTLAEYPYINTTGMRLRVGSSNADRGCSNNNTTDSRPDDPDNAASSSTSDNKSGGVAVSEAGNPDDDRPSANSTDEDKCSNSRKSGRTRTLFGAPRDPVLTFQCESDPEPSTSSAEADNSVTRTSLDTMVREAIDNYANRGPQRAQPRPDPPGMPSEVEIDLGKMAATAEEMAWDETRRDSVEASEEDTDTSNSKPKRQKLDSGIGEASPSGSSTEKTKSENSDTDSPLQSDCPNEDIEGSIDRVVRGRARSPSYWSASPEEMAHRERVLRRIARGGDARRARLSYLMKQAVRELPLPHALKKFVNLGRCFEF